MPRPEWIEVGRISRPHGVQGEVRVSLSSDNPERFLPGAMLHARPGRGGIAAVRLPEQARLTVETVRGSEDFPIVGFREIPDRARAEAFSGYVLEIRASQLPELDEDEFYPFDLVGLEARDPSGLTLGEVSDCLESPAHDILVVSLKEGGQALVPFVQAAVPVVAVDAGYLVVEPGLASSALSPGGDNEADAASEGEGAPSGETRAAEGGPA